MFFISFFVLIYCSNIVKSIIFILVMQTTVIVFWLTIGRGEVPPIINDPYLLETPERIADPLPQALMLTAIIIGISVVAVKIIMLNTVFRKHRLTEWKDIEKAENDTFKKELYGEHIC
jgi:multicomponent Na+:H+ antiporter subunit C